MFEPKYSLHTDLLNNLLRIKTLINELNAQDYPDLALSNFEKDSNAVSAFASTSIEGNPLALTEVRRILKNKPTRIRDTEREILNYNTALEYLNTSLPDPKKITIGFICHIQSLVTDGLIEKHNHGKIRTAPVVVNDPRKRQVVYIPPNIEDVSPLLQQLITFVEKQGGQTDPLILAGIFHKQFVIVHPFMDGNGRTTRLITKYLLARMGLDTFKLFSFENYYNKNVTKYFASVGEYGDYYEIQQNVDFTSWLIYFTDGIIDELLRVQNLLSQTIVSLRVEEYEQNIISYLQNHSTLAEADYAMFTTRARSTRILDFKRLVEKGTLIRHGKGKSTYYTLVTK